MPETLFQLAELYFFSHSNNAHSGLPVWCIYTNDFPKNAHVNCGIGDNYIGKSFYVPKKVSIWVLSAGYSDVNN